MAGARIKRIEPTADLSKALDTTDEARHAFVYAKHGIWYDAIDSLSSSINAAPGDPQLRAQRAALLDQVMLGDVAEFDRSNVKDN